MNFKMPTRVMKLYKVRLITTPNIASGGFMPSYKVFCKYTLFYDSNKHIKAEFIKSVPHSDFTPTYVTTDIEREEIIKKVIKEKMMNFVEEECSILKRQDNIKNIKDHKSKPKHYPEESKEHKEFYPEN